MSFRPLLSLQAFGKNGALEHINRLQLMNVKTLPMALCIAGGAVATAAFADTSPAPAAKASHKVEMQQIRNATVKITYAGTTFLIDPMLAERERTQGLKIPTAATFAILWSNCPNPQMRSWPASMRSS